MARYGVQEIWGPFLMVPTERIILGVYFVVPLFVGTTRLNYRSEWGLLSPTFTTSFSTFRTILSLSTYLWGGVGWGGVGWGGVGWGGVGGPVPETLNPEYLPS